MYLTRYLQGTLASKYLQGTLLGALSLHRKKTNFFLSRSGVGVVRVCVFLFFSFLLNKSCLFFLLKRAGFVPEISSRPCGHRTELLKETPRNYDSLMLDALKRITKSVVFFTF